MSGIITLALDVIVLKKKREEQETYHKKIINIGCERTKTSYGE